MKFTPPTPIIKAVVVTGIMAVVGWIGLDIPRAVVEETVDQQFDSFTTGNDTSTYSAIPTAAYVTKVIDGDTVKVEIAGQPETIRLVGINTPETAGSPAGAQCYGDEATEYLRTLVEGQAVTVIVDSTQADRDQYSRLLRYVTLSDGRDVGQIMIEEGYAEERTYAADYSNQAMYRQAEHLARQAGRGQWTSCQ